MGGVGQVAFVAGKAGYPTIAPVARKLTLLATAAAMLGLVTFWRLTIPSTVLATSLPPHTADPSNGKEMFFAGGCASCHTVPNQPDMTLLGGGLGLRSPFGTFYVPNISPDPKDGIGAWTEEQFITALNKGTSPAGDHYYPAFPYTSFQHIRFDDLRDLFSYLKTLPSVQGRVRDHDLPFPFNIRRTLGIWKLLYLEGEPFKPDASKAAQWNRGAYLVNGPGHCAECHSPRNALGAINTKLRFTGGPSPDGQGRLPNITQFKLLKRWSEADIAKMLEDGMTPHGDKVEGPMSEVVRNTSQLSAEDRMAIAIYVKSLPPVEGQPPAKK